MPQLIDAQIGVRPVGQAEGRRGTADFLHGDDVREVAQLGAAVFTLDRDAEKSQFSEFRPEVPRKLVAGIDIPGARRDTIVCKAAHSLAQQIEVLTVTKVEFKHGSAPFRSVYRAFHSPAAAQVFEYLSDSRHQDHGSAH